MLDDNRETLPYEASLHPTANWTCLLVASPYELDVYTSPAWSDCSGSLAMMMLEIKSATDLSLQAGSTVHRHIAKCLPLLDHRPLP
jgi:hypothetical protein